jgi:surface protein
MPLSRSTTAPSSTTGIFASFTGKINALDAPKILPNTNLSNAFYNSKIVTINFGNIGLWDTMNVTSMFCTFGNTNFNQNIGLWNTSLVKNMGAMFQNNPFFNQNISGWNTSLVTNMYYMFFNNTNFNQNIGSWTTSLVTDMSYMLSGTGKFNQNIGGWNTSSVKDMGRMFQNNPVFNQNIGTWNTSLVTDMSYMLSGTGNFNQNIGGWNTSSVKDMGRMFQNNPMFYNATLFNNGAQSGVLDPINNAFYWNTGNVTSMSSMFNGAIAFNQHIGTFDTRKVTSVNALDMFTGAIAFLDPDGIKNPVNNPQTILTDGTRLTYAQLSDPVGIYKYTLTELAVYVPSVPVVTPPVVTPVPVVKPSSPSITAVNARDGKAMVTFTGGVATDLALENHYYSIDGGASYVGCAPVKKTSGQTLAHGFVNGVVSTIRMIVKDVSGNASEPSNVWSGVKCIGKPGAPQNVDISLNNSTATINFTAGSENGEAASKYYYSLNGGLPMDPSRNASPITITLPYGVASTIKIQGENTEGRGEWSSSKTVTAVPPASPVGAMVIDSLSTYTDSTKARTMTTTIRFTDASGTIPGIIKSYKYKNISASPPEDWKIKTTIQDPAGTGPTQRIMTIINELKISTNNTIIIMCEMYASGVITTSLPSIGYTVFPVKASTKSGSVVNGYISGGTITILDTYGNVIGGPVTTNSVGEYTISGENLPEYYIVRCVGGTNLATNQASDTELRAVVVNTDGNAEITDATVIITPLTTIVTKLVESQISSGAVIDVTGAITKVATALDIPINQVSQDYLASSNVTVASASVKMATITASISSATGLSTGDVMSSISELINNTTGKLVIDQSTVNTIVTTTTTNLGVNTPVPESVLTTLSSLVVAVSDAMNVTGISLTTLYKTEVGAKTLASGITSSSGDITGQLAGAVSSATIGTITLPIISGNICFKKGTKIVTDQGIIEIEKMTKKNSIRGKEVVLISKTKNIDDYLIKIEKGGLYENVPNADTYVTGEHKIYYNREMIRAKKLVNGKTITKADSLNDTVYNVLLEGEEVGKMIANGLISETLNPKGEMVKLLCYVEKLGMKEREEVIEEVNINLKKEHEGRRKKV